MNAVERFAARVKQERRRLGVSQERLADMAGLHRTYVSNLERAQINPTLRTLDAVARALDLELVDLLGAPPGARSAEDPSVGEAHDGVGEEGDRVGEGPHRYTGGPASGGAGMRLRITLEADERGELRGSGRARFGDRVFPFRVDDVRDGGGGREDRSEG